MKQFKKADSDTIAQNPSFLKKNDGKFLVKRLPTFARVARLRTQLTDEGGKLWMLTLATSDKVRTSRMHVHAVWIRKWACMTERIDLGCPHRLTRNFRMHQAYSCVKD